MPVASTTVSRTGLSAPSSAEGTVLPEASSTALVDAKNHARDRVASSSDNILSPPSLPDRNKPETLDSNVMLGQRAVGSDPATSSGGHAKLQEQNNPDAASQINDRPMAHGGQPSANLGQLPSPAAFASAQSTPHTAHATFTTSVRVSEAPNLSNLAVAVNHKAPVSMRVCGVASDPSQWSLQVPLCSYSDTILVLALANGEDGMRLAVVPLAAFEEAKMHSAEITMGFVSMSNQKDTVEELFKKCVELGGAGIDFQYTAKISVAISEADGGVGGPGSVGAGFLSSNKSTPSAIGVLPPPIPESPSMYCTCARPFPVQKGRDTVEPRGMYF